MSRAGSFPVIVLQDASRAPPACEEQAPCRSASFHPRNRLLKPFPGILPLFGACSFFRSGIFPQCSDSLRVCVPYAIDLQEGPAPLFGVSACRSIASIRDIPGPLLILEVLSRLFSRRGALAFRSRWSRLVQAMVAVESRAGIDPVEEVQAIFYIMKNRKQRICNILVHTRDR